MPRRMEDWVLPMADLDAIADTRRGVFPGHVTGALRCGSACSSRAWRADGLRIGNRSHGSRWLREFLAGERRPTRGARTPTCPMSTEARRVTTGLLRGRARTWQPRRKHPMPTVFRVGPYRFFFLSNEWFEPHTRTLKRRTGCKIMAKARCLRGSAPAQRQADARSSP
jgi:hypothetical protein